MYDKYEFTENNPGLIIILIDQSGSMNDAYNESTKAGAAARAVNECIYELMTLSKSKKRGLRPKMQVGVFGYQDGGVKLIVGGKPAVVMSHPDKPDWVRTVIMVNGKEEKIAKGGTPMHLAFDKASEMIEKSWRPHFPDSFPPIVINISDGIPDDEPMAKKAADHLTSLATSDGKVLLFNAHIAETNEPAVEFPIDPPRDSHARFLFEISSVMPAPMVEAAQKAKINTGPGARGFVFNARAQRMSALLTIGSLSNVQAGRPAAERT